MLGKIVTKREPEDRSSEIKIGELYRIKADLIPTWDMASFKPDGSGKGTFVSKHYNNDILFFVVGPTEFSYFGQIDETTYTIPCFVSGVLGKLYVSSTEYCELI